MTKLFKSKFFNEPQNTIAVGVTVISLCALIVSVIQTRVLKEEQELMREHYKASVWPRIELGLEKSHNLTNDSVTHFAINISNNGVGPAIISDVKVSYNDTIARDWWHLFKLQKIPDSIDMYISNRSFNGQIIKIGETIEILNLDINLPLANAFYEKFEGMSIEIYYESIYGEKWRLKGGTTTKLEDFKGLPAEEQFW